ncbi:MAG: cytochrome c biogenesis protein CcsA [Xanthomonadaceae bacterium]|nr:cytochrome c biogenesis protein CcsA [Xanthomonadaceae bacterium]
MAPVVWLVFTAFAYLGASALLALQGSGRARHPLLSRRAPGLTLGLAAVVLHTIALRQQLFVGDGLNLGVFQVASLVGWQIAIVVLVAAARLPMAGLAALTLPLVAVAAVMPAWFQSATVLENLGRQLEAHILLSLLAYALLAVAAVQALLLTAQDRHLRGHRPGGWVRALPPLEAMESLLFKLIAWGFVLLGLSLATGFLFVDDLLAQHLVHKTVLSVLAWVLFGVLLWGRWQRGWRGRTALRWTLTAFAVLALAYFGSKLVLELILGRHWG